MLPKKGGFICCPHCGAKLIKPAPDTVAARLPVWCRDCRREILIDILRGRSFESRSPGKSRED